MSAYDRELREWFESLIDGTIDEASHRALADRLDADESARRALVDHIGLHASLNWEHAEPLIAEAAERVEPAEAIVARIEPARVRRAWPVMMAIAAAVVIAGVVAAVVMTAIKPPVIEAPKRPPVAMLLGDANVRWASEPRSVGEPVSPQTLAIESGVLDLRFNSGAVMAVRGPGELTLLTANRCRLERGTVTVHAPDGADGFTVETPHFEVVDLGTGFGVRGGADGGGAVHVFEGEVELRLAGGERKVLRAGDAAEVDAAGVMRDVPIDVFAFPPKADDPAPRWADFADRLALDPSLLLHVTVREADRATPTENALTVADHSKHRRTVRLLGGKPAGGRLGHDTAIGVVEPTDGVAFDLPGSHRTITMAMWMRLDRLPKGIASLIQTDGYSTGQPHWNLDATGAMTLGIAGGAVVSAREVIGVDRVGRWTHLAVTYDADAAWIAMYVDGRPVLDRAIDKALAVHFGPSRIGNWDRERRPLPGVAADVVVFDRSLAAEQVRQLYEAGAP